MPTTLSDWLAYLETLHPKAIAMGLDRVRRVQGRLHADPDCPVITVTGTNGKGSTCAMLEAILRAARYRTALYTSPHLLRYNERVRIDGDEASDADLCEAFAAVEAVRGDVPLTYFEFGTLAALWLFAREAPDVLILEVGLGGRLDAVNATDADVAILTTVDLDHMDYLGSTREDIGREKAGIFRGGRPAICAEPKPPESVQELAREIGADLRRIGVDFGYVGEGTQWQFWVREDNALKRRFGLPYPALRGSYQLANASAALAALETLQRRMPVSMGAVRQGLLQVDLPGRFQVLPGRPALVLDVAHNPHAARVLADNLQDMGFFARTCAVFAMYGDKDAGGVIEVMKSRIDRWYIAPLPGPRGGSAAAVEAALHAHGVAPASITSNPSVEAAFQTAWEQAEDADRIVAFGSFLTVAAVLTARNEAHKGET
jgi:dihydrofolate synthase/folylpolyglutamate synthase